MADYALSADPNIVIRTADSAHIPNDPANRDWQEYQVWLDAGNVPDPYVPPPPPEQYVQSVQWFVQLVRVGKYADWDTWVASQDDETQVSVKSANGFVHHDGVIDRAVAALGWTPEQVEAWLDAAKQISPYP